MDERMNGGSKRWDRVGIVMGVFVFAAGVQHFVNPTFFDDIVPPWLPPGERFWTYASGVAELIIGAMLLIPRHRRQGALAAIALFIAVYPANIYMVWDWRDRELSERLVSYGRLPLQFVIIWLAWKVSVTRRPSTPR
jgi:uncharacterized membrane protein